MVCDVTPQQTTEMKYEMCCLGRVVIFVGSLVLIVEAPITAQSAKAGWMPFEMVEQSALPIVRAKFNKSETYRLLLDPSFEETILDMTFVVGRNMSLLHSEHAVEIDYYGEKEKVPVAFLDEISIGNLSFQKVMTLLVEGDDSTTIGGIRSFGRIGRSILEPLRLTIHYPRQLLLLEEAPDEVPPGSVPYVIKGRFMSIPAKVTTPRGQQEIDFVFDPGASGSVIDRKWAIEQGIATKTEDRTKIPAMQIGGLFVENTSVLLGVMRELPYRDKKTKYEPLGLIGAELMFGLSVTYDFSRDLVWLVQVEKKEKS